MVITVFAAAKIGAVGSRFHKEVLRRLVDLKDARFQSKVKFAKSKLLLKDVPLTIAKKVYKRTLPGTSGMRMGMFKIILKLEHEKYLF